MIKVSIQTTNNKHKVFTETGEIHYVSNLHIDYPFNQPPIATIEHFVVDDFGKIQIDTDRQEVIKNTFKARVANIVLNWDFTQ